MFEELKTPRLTIRKFKPSDVDGLFKVLSDAEVMRYIEPPFTLEKTAEFVKNYGMCTNPQVFALIKDKSNLKTIDGEGPLIGHVIFHRYPDEILAKKHGEVYEIGFIIAKEFWRQGIAGEITEALISYAKESGIKALVLECDKENVASIKIAQKFDFHNITQSETPNDSLLTFILPL